MKTGTSFVRKRLARFAKCADALFSCVQLAPDNGACLAKARTRCDQSHAATAADERKLGSTITERCGEHVIAYATLRAARAANLDALAAGCAAVGVPALASLADYQQCVLRADGCRIDDVLAVQAPRIAELLAVVGRAFGNPYCQPLSAPGAHRANRRGAGSSAVTYSNCVRNSSGVSPATRDSDATSFASVKSLRRRRIMYRRAIK